MPLFLPTGDVEARPLKPLPLPDGFKQGFQHDQVFLRKARVSFCIEGNPLISGFLHRVPAVINTRTLHEIHFFVLARPYLPTSTDQLDCGDNLIVAPPYYSAERVLNLAPAPAGTPHDLANHLSVEAMAAVDSEGPNIKDIGPTPFQTPKNSNGAEPGA